MGSEVLVDVPVVGGTGRSQAFPCVAGEVIGFRVAVSGGSDGGSVSTWVSWSDDGRNFDGQPDLFSAAGGIEPLTARGAHFRFNWSVVGDGFGVSFGTDDVAPAAVEAPVAPENAEPAGA